jgi:hypothetical protein
MLVLSRAEVDVARKLESAIAMDMPPIEKGRRDFIVLMSMTLQG